MKRKEFFYLLFCTAISVGMMSCSSKEDNENGNENSSLESIMASNNEQEVLLNIDYSQIGSSQVAFDVYSENPYITSSQNVLSLKNNISPLVSSMTDEKGNYNLSRLLPGNVKELFIVSNSVGTPLLMHADIINGRADFFECDINNVNNETKQSSRATCPFLKLGSWNNLGKPNYIDKQFKNNIEGSELNAISSALPEWKKVNENLCKSNGIHISKTGKVWISVISNKSIFNNTLGYYCYRDNDNANSIKEIIAFPSTVTYSLLDGLRQNQYIQLKYYDSKTGTFSESFPEGTNIGFVLHTSSFCSFNGSVDDGNNKFYSNSAFNVEKNNKNHAAIFSTSKGNIIMGFEDINNDYGDNDCNDVIFNVSSNDSGVLSLDIPSASDENDVVTTEVVKSIKSLKDILPSIASNSFYRDLYVKTTSTLKIVNGEVVSVEDKMYIASAYNIYQLLMSDKNSSNIVMFCNIGNYFNSRMTGTMFHTTIKRAFEEDGISVRSVNEVEYRPASDVLLDALNSYKSKLNEGKIIYLCIGYEFTPANYFDFMSTIKAAPFTPYIVND